MPDYLDKVKRYAGVFGTGLLRQMAPDIAGGMLNELFHTWNVDVDKVCRDVQDDRPIWDDLKPDQRKHLFDAARSMGNLNFLTVEVVVNGIKKDFPAVAGLFLTWPEAHDWLTRQLDILKREVLSSTE